MCSPRFESTVVRDVLVHPCVHVWRVRVLCPRYSQGLRAGVMRSLSALGGDLVDCPPSRLPCGVD